MKVIITTGTQTVTNFSYYSLDFALEDLAAAA
jgi:hypothetical protein